VVLANSGLADTSWFVAAERRGLTGARPSELAVSIVTIGELRLGVLVARDDRSRAQRLNTLLYAEQLSPIPIDRPVAEAWAQLIQALRAVGRRLPINDSWIAATAIAHGLPVVTQDADYDGVPGLHVISV
jgi:predicted nucleic acid-binding protein